MSRKTISISGHANCAAFLALQRAAHCATQADAYRMMRHCPERDRPGLALALMRLGFKVQKQWRPSEDEIAEAANAQGDVVRRMFG